MNIPIDVYTLIPSIDLSRFLIQLTLNYTCENLIILLITYQIHFCNNTQELK